jgi:L-threonylcarbamoyladenylate synthase
MAGKCQIYHPTPRNIAFLAERLRAGEIVGVPTETVYGLAAVAFDPKACAKIFRAKGRPADDPLIVHIHSISQLDEISFPNEASRSLAEAFWPGPLTMVLPKKNIVPEIVTAGRDSVAVRMPSHALFRRLLRATGLPLAAPSANSFGYISPTTAAHVSDGLGRKIRYVLDGGAARIGLESTIVDLRDPKRPSILRPGFIEATDIGKVIGKPVRTSAAAQNPKAVAPQHHSAGTGRSLRLSRESNPGTGHIAPGMMARHYSPRTPLRLHETLRLPPQRAAKEAYLFLRKPAGRPRKNVFWLDRRGDLRGVGRRLFAMLRKLDSADFSVIHTELARGHGLAEAINDRLRRAAAR